uniref:NADH-ubiquinone oxidoreductase chain 5 n=1 Tax=Pachyphlegyas modiglianii TaxID=2816051 RepID=A0A8T9ZWJ4_9HEMI|nr:NADH dehydrogenase subunit 5 [Pachyphlegyas modiglianii]
MYYLVYVMLFFFSLSIFFISVIFMYMDIYMLIDYNFLHYNSCSFVFTFLFDWMSMLFMSVVLLISSMVIYYSGSYMMSDSNNRFLFLVLLFILSMSLMILSPNLVSILIGWDGLGLISYCLVIFYQNMSSYNSGMLTILTNRLGDVGIILGISLMFNGGDFNYLYMNFYLNNYSFVMMLMIVMASFTKSAQIPFSSWLPAAMAAPTPVSSLVHSSTLVTAGVYLLIRFNGLMAMYNMDLFLYLSMVTMIMSGLGANFEFDLKKIIALSTLSQLGLMMSLLFMGFPLISFFHLLSHAFFKSLLFLCAGLMIHCINDSQDIRNMGGLLMFIPYTCSCFCISNFSLCGLPFLSGFYSKDLGLEMLSFSTSNFFLYLCFYLSLSLTVSYTIRLIYYLMMGGNNLYYYMNYYEDPKMMASMIYLSMMSIMGGSLMSWLIFIDPIVLFLSSLMKIMSLLFIVIGGYFMFLLSLLSLSFESLMLNYIFCISYLGNMWFMPYFSTYMIYSKSNIMSTSYSYFMDYGWGENLFSKMLLNFPLLMSEFEVKISQNNFKISLTIFIFFISFMFII